jgi:dipeptidase D
VYRLFRMKRLLEVLLPLAICAVGAAADVVDAAAAAESPICAPYASALDAGARAVTAAKGDGASAFDAFRLAAGSYARTGGKPSLGRRIESLVAGRAVPGAEAELASCILRRYVQARYGAAIVRDLQAMVTFQTVAVEGKPNWDLPELVRQREWLARRAAGLGLAFKDYDGRVEEITLPGPPPILALLTHGDVQGVEGQQWSSPPFEARQVGEDRIVGRGTEDDKGPLVAALYAMAALADSGWPRSAMVRLLVANGEETSWDEIPYYLARAPMPQTTIGLDAAYPVTHAQKGYGVLTFTSGPLAHPPKPGRYRLLRMEGGSGMSIIPERGAALLQPAAPGDLDASLAEVARAAERWAAAHPPARLTATREGEAIRVVALGKGGHSSEPASGHNALADLASFVSTLDLTLDRWGALAAFVGGALGTESDGRSLGIARRDPVMGELTANLSFLREKDGAPVAEVNIRHPQGLGKAEIERSLAERTAIFDRASSAAVSASTAILSEPHLAPADGRLVQSLLAVWREVTGEPGRQIAIGGGTQARLFPGGVDFGPSTDMVHYRGHGTDEYMTVPELLRVAELTVAALWKLGRAAPAAAR